MSHGKKTIFYGKRLRVLRSVDGLSIIDVANKTGVSKQAISKIESGKMRPSKALMIGLCKLLEVTEDYFTADKITLHIRGNDIKLITT